MVWRVNHAHARSSAGMGARLSMVPVRRCRDRHEADRCGRYWRAGHQHHGHVGRPRTALLHDPRDRIQHHGHGGCGHCPASRTRLDASRASPGPTPPSYRGENGAPIMATAYASMPTAWSNKKQVERLRRDAYESLTRMLNRAVADTGVNFSIWSALRTHADQVALFKANYTKVSRGRKYSTDRAYAGSIWARKPGGVSVASPDLGSNHQDGLAVDIHPGKIQTWIQRNGLLYGWSWDEGKRVGESWHFRYIPSRDQMKHEGPLDHAAIQKVVGATVDGKIGTGTVAKIKAWQKKHGLTADGKVGAKTKQKMGLAGKDDVAPAVPVTPGG